MAIVAELSPCPSDPPIHRIPPELLIPILHQLLLPWKLYHASIEFFPIAEHREHSKRVYWEDRSANWNANTTTLVRFTHVCRRWRSLALETPLWWSHIDFRYPNRALELVKRCQPRIPVSLALNQPLDVPEAHRFLQSVHRMDLDLSPIRISRADLLKFATPSLEVLTVTLPLHKQYGRQFAETRKLAFHAPSLKALSLYGVHHTWPFKGSFPALTHLDITWKIKGDHPLFGGVLSQMPALESLSLCEPPWVISGAGPVALPRLRSFWLCAEYLYDAVAVLEQFSLPTHCRVQLKTIETESGDGLALLRPVRVTIAAAQGRATLGLDTEGGMRVEVLLARYPVAGYFVTLDFAQTHTLHLALERWDNLRPLLDGAPHLSTLVLSPFAPAISGEGERARHAESKMRDAGAAAARREGLQVRIADLEETVEGWDRGSSDADHELQSRYWSLWPDEGARAFPRYH